MCKALHLISSTVKSWRKIWYLLDHRNEEEMVTDFNTVTELRCKDYLVQPPHLTNEETVTLKEKCFWSTIQFGTNMVLGTLKRQILNVTKFEAEENNGKSILQDIS